MPEAIAMLHEAVSPVTQLVTQSDDVSHTSQHPKYRSLVERLKCRINSGDTFFSLEFFPPRSSGGALNLVAKFERMRSGLPLFCDITWHPAGDPGADKPTSSVAVASAMLNYCGLETVLHMTCCGQSRLQIGVYLERAKQLGIRNILALRGDPPVNQDEWTPSEDGFNYATDLIRFIRQKYGDYFVICAAAYPNGHPDCASYEEDLVHLKEKVDAGVDFLITQLFFEAKTFINFHRDCRAIGIDIPIIPGVLPIQGYQSLRHIVKLSKLTVPDDIQTVVTRLRDDDTAIRAYGVASAVKLCRELLDAGIAPGIHLYTLNREAASIDILQQLGLWGGGAPRPPLPWRPTANHARCCEDVRPIFWSSRPCSYVQRTASWGEFPSGRWGDASIGKNKSFGDVNDPHLLFLRAARPPNALAEWGDQLESEADVWNVFRRYITGETNSQGVKVTQMAWCDVPLAPETRVIADQLASINSRGVLTINSQPSINGVASTDPVFGWGIPGGYVYQKAYLEFFTCQRNLASLKEVLAEYGGRVNYHIVDNSGDKDYTNCDKLQPIAVTWGVFPGREIIQPTVVDPISFKSWKNEAFDLWREQWGSLYERDSRSWQVIETIADTYHLVYLVDNNYPEPSCLFHIVEQMLQRASGSTSDKQNVDNGE